MNYVQQIGVNLDIFARFIHIKINELVKIDHCKDSSMIISYSELDGIRFFPMTFLFSVSTITIIFIFAKKQIILILHSCFN